MNIAYVQKLHIWVMMENKLIIQNIIIYNRVDSTKENMGLTNWEKSPDDKILKSETTIAKNYLDEKDLKI